MSDIDSKIQDLEQELAAMRTEIRDLGDRLGAGDVSVRATLNPAIRRARELSSMLHDLEVASGRDIGFAQDMYGPPPVMWRQQVSAPMYGPPPVNLRGETPPHPPVEPLLRSRKSSEIAEEESAKSAKDQGAGLGFFRRWLKRK